jgi:MoaA/NifB/PqqE/SkfB family radical SAM enzyme
MVSHRSFAAAKRNIEQIRRSDNHIVLSGGEPTIYPNIEKIIKLCRSKKFKKIEIITNGRLLADRAFAKKIIMLGTTGFAVSVYGISAGTHDAITRVKGSFLQTKAGVKNLCLLAKKYQISVRINTVLTKQNISEIRGIFEKFSAMGARDYLIAEHIVTNKEEGHLTVAEIRSFFDTMRRIELPGASIQLRGFAPCLLRGKKIIQKDHIEIRRQDPHIILEKHNVDTLIEEKERKKEYRNRFSGRFEWHKRCATCGFFEHCAGLQKCYANLQRE